MSFNDLIAHFSADSIGYIIYPINHWIYHGLSIHLVEDLLIVSKFGS